MRKNKIKTISKWLLFQHGLYFSLHTMEFLFLWHRGKVFSTHLLPFLRFFCSLKYLPNLKRSSPEFASNLSSHTFSEQWGSICEVRVIWKLAFTFRTYLVLANYFQSSLPFSYETKTGEHSHKLSQKQQKRQMV